MDHPCAFRHAAEVNGAAGKRQPDADRLRLRVRGHDRVRNLAPTVGAEDNFLHGVGNASDRERHADHPRAGDGDLVRIAIDLRRDGLSHSDGVALALCSSASVRVPRVDDDPAEPSALEVPPRNDAGSRDHLVRCEDAGSGARTVRDDQGDIEAPRRAVLHARHRGTNGEPGYIARHGHNGSASSPIVSG